MVCLDPGYIAAGLGIKSQTGGGAFAADDIRRRAPTGRFGSRRRSPRPSSFASDEARYLSATHLTVDGGLSPTAAASQFRRRTEMAVCLVADIDVHEPETCVEYSRRPRQPVRATAA